MRKTTQPKTSTPTQPTPRTFRRGVKGQHLTGTKTHLRVSLKYLRKREALRNPEHPRPVSYREALAFMQVKANTLFFYP